jgi:hypothetical protein
VIFVGTFVVCNHKFSIKKTAVEEKEVEKKPAGGAVEKKKTTAGKSEVPPNVSAHTRGSEKIEKQVEQASEPAAKPVTEIESEKGNRNTSH